ncbi:origin recognition complex subunit 5 C-terminus-domain-containing protein [Mycena pura]|uniref:Origin recognition complex subunit 5 C-terminus-domain-containing protein n=1 Tax=Mycena pura TaxID=153505 RepID=A0AAD6VSP1_9AGAR|nr:origin recognition complex subunit 5 C-terminus-domain-containing protein [Mycena pura]
MASDHPGYERLVDELSVLFSARAPPFLYVHDPVSSRTTAAVINRVLSSLAHSSDASSRVTYAQINAVACLSPRILYDTVLNQLVQWQVKWEDGCANWGGDSDQRWNQNLDGFLHGLKAVHSFISQRHAPNSDAKGKSKEADADVAVEEGQIVIVVEHAERLQDRMPDLVVPLTRLAELARLDLSMIFVSEVPWEEIRPPFGGSPDPYYVDVAPLDRPALLSRLESVFHDISSLPEHRDAVTPYHPSLRPLYFRFLEVLVDSCSLYVQDASELQYIAAARWPGFVQPVLDAHRHRPDSDVDMVGNDSYGVKTPTEDVRMRLIRIFKPTFKAALESLYPRLDHAASWAASHEPEANLLAKPASETQPLADDGEVEVGDGRMADLPQMSKFILVAAYIASTNPHTSDLRMFGRGLDEKKRRRRVNRVSAKTGPTKLPQRVVGPSPFPLDRLIAILGALLEDNDADQRPPAPEYLIPGEYTDMETSRVGIYSTIVELADVGLLHRNSGAEKLDGATFKCGVSYDTASALAQQLDVPFNDLLWDPA